MRSLPPHTAGSSNVLRNQTTPSKPASPASSQNCGRRILFHPDASSEGSAQLLFAAEPGAFSAHQSSSALSYSTAGLVESAQVFSNSLTAGANPFNSESASGLTQPSAAVPPQDECMRPTGTFSSLCRRRPKKYATAEKPPHPPAAMFVGLQTSQRALTVVRGLVAAIFGTAKRRIRG